MQAAAERPSVRPGILYDKLHNNQRIVMLTAFYDIGRDSWESAFKRGPQTYLDAARNYLKHNYRIIFFIDERYFTVFTSS